VPRGLLNLLQRPGSGVRKHVDLSRDAYLPAVRRPGKDFAALLLSQAHEDVDLAGIPFAQIVDRHDEHRHLPDAQLFAPAEDLTEVLRTVAVATLTFMRET
jgi:hypothetical protein